MSAAELERPRDEQFKWNRQWPLCVTTVLFLVVAPLPPGMLAGAGPVVEVVLLTLLFGAGAYCVARNRWMFIASLVVGLAAAVGQSMIQLGGQRGATVTLVFHITAIAFVAIVGLHVVRSLFRTSRVTGDTILGGVTAYLLVGILFAFAFSLVETMWTGSFYVPETMVEADGAMRWFPAGEAAELGKLQVLYFSFTTLTTLGYGDIAPRSGVACVLSSTEAVIGQLYLAILIARLVAVAKIGKDN